MNVDTFSGWAPQGAIYSGMGFGGPMAGGQGVLEI